jgi:hypothetical protein
MSLDAARRRGRKAGVWLRVTILAIPFVVILAAMLAFVVCAQAGVGVWRGLREARVLFRDACDQVKRELTGQRLT